MDELCGYVCFWKGQRREVHAATAYAARELARAAFGRRCKGHDVSVTLAETPAGPVTHVAVD